MKSSKSRSKRSAASTPTAPAASEVNLIHAAHAVPAPDLFRWVAGRLVELEFALLIGEKRLEEEDAARSAAVRRILAGIRINGIQKRFDRLVAMGKAGKLRPDDDVCTPASERQRAEVIVRTTHENLTLRMMTMEEAARDLVDHALLYFVKRLPPAARDASRFGDVVDAMSLRDEEARTEHETWALVRAGMKAMGFLDRAHANKAGWVHRTFRTPNKTSPRRRAGP